MVYDGKNGEYFELQKIDSHNSNFLKNTKTQTLLLIWFTSDQNKLTIDGIPYTFEKNEIVFLTEFHRLEYDNVKTINLLRFNKSFYCVLDHDSEIGCKGILYYGAAAKLPIIKINEIPLDIMQTAWKMATLEFEMKDSLQLEMLQMMLKRILITCTRVYKMQSLSSITGTEQNDLIRNFNFLVETNFRSKHTVADYASLIYKSPKTISNTFKKLGTKSPLKFIQERIMLEARRLISYTDKDISEIAYELGFNDIQTFSRFFKKNEKIAPIQYRKKNTL